MTNTENEYADCAPVGHNKNPDDLSEIAKLAEEQLAVEQEIDDLEDKVVDAKKRLKVISELKIPEKMDALGLSKYETTSGIHVSVKEDIRGTLPAEKRPQGFAWMEANGAGALIKSNVVVPYGRNEIDKAGQLVETLQAEGRLANLDRKVEAMTLTSFIKEQLTAGKDIPLDIFSVYRQRVAKVKV